MIDIEELKKLAEAAGFTFADNDASDGSFGMVVFKRFADNVSSVLQSENAKLRQELEEARKDAGKLRTKALELCEWSVEALERIEREWGAGRRFNELRSYADDDALLIQGVIDAAQPPYSCNACNWTGRHEETVMLGAVGPLCPECRETTDKTG